MKALTFICFALIFINLSSAIKLSPLKFDQEVCFIHSYPRGKPQRMTDLGCPKGYFYDFGRCFEQCGYSGYDTYSSSRICSKPCPQGFKSLNGFLCSRSPRLEESPSYKGIIDCEQVHGKCGEVDDSIAYNVFQPYCDATSQLHILNYCVPEFRKRMLLYAERCQDGLEEVDELCYPPCDSGFEGLGDICIEPCPKGYLRCGNVCTTGTSCENGKVQRIQATVSAIEEIVTNASIDMDLGNMMCS